MRSVFAISTAIALFASSAFAASNNADFNPVNFAAEEVAATPLTEDFVTFRWKGEESLAKESFDFNVVEEGARIQVTDYKNRGDMFEVFDNGVSIGMTTKVDANKDEQVFAATPEEALKDERFSKGVFDLGKGAHKITIKAMGPYEAGTAAIRVLDHSNVAFHKKGGKHHDDDDDDKDDHGDDHDDDHDDKDDDDHDDKDDDDHDDKDDHDDHDDHDDEDDHDDKDDDHHDDGKKKWGSKWGNKWGGNKGDDNGNHSGGNKWNNNNNNNNNKWQEGKYPGHDLDLSHTVTFTKTKWVVEQPTFLPEEGGNNGEHGGQHWGKKWGNHGDDHDDKNDWGHGGDKNEWDHDDKNDWGHDDKHGDNHDDKNGWGHDDKNSWEHDDDHKYHKGGDDYHKDNDYKHGGHY